MIKTEAIKKNFTTEDVETRALNGVTLQVQQGEFVAIMGPSGCGKSTLLNVLGLLDNPTEGKYWFKGIDVAEFTEDKRTSLRKGTIGFVFQSFNLIDDLTVYENIELPLLYMGIPKQERQKRVNAIMERLDSTSCQIFSTATFRRSATACSCGTCSCNKSGTYTCRRTYRKPGFQKRTGGDGVVASIKFRRYNHNNCNPFSA